MQSNEILSHHEMCGREQLSLQRGMNFCPLKLHSILLSSLRPNSPYDDRMEDGGTVLIYEGHDEPRSASNKDPKLLDQPLMSKNGRFTQNGLFHEAAQAYKNFDKPPRTVRVYEKIKNGIWSYNGIFLLVDSWFETNERRQVCKFQPEAVEDMEDTAVFSTIKVEPRRVIPSAVRLEVWKRDGGKCVICGQTSELHFDHILPYSKGGTSDTAENIQLLCMRHNLAKKDRIE